MLFQFVIMAEVSPEPNLPSGYDDEFVEPVNVDLRCGICRLPMRDPMITRCGHHFCRECIEEHLRREKHKDQNGFCPVDREAVDLEKDMFPNKEKERQILSLAVRCGSKDCEWADELRSQEWHLKECPFGVIPCPDCKVTMVRKDLDGHSATQCPWRMVHCDFCQKQYPDCRMEVHLDSCDRYPVHCEQCNATASREMLQDHMKNYCGKTKLPCYFAKLGCEKQVPRENLDDHLLQSHKEHLNLLVDEIYKHREKEDFLQNQIATLQEQGEANEAKIQQMNEKQHALERQMDEKANDMKREMDEKANDMKREMDEKEKKGLERQIYGEKWSKYTSIAFFILIVIIFVIMVFYFGDLERQMDEKEYAVKGQMDEKEQALKRKMGEIQEELKRLMDGKEQALMRTMGEIQEELKRLMDGKEQALMRKMREIRGELKRLMDDKDEVLQKQLDHVYVIGGVVIAIISIYFLKAATVQSG